MKSADIRVSLLALLPALTAATALAQDTTPPTPDPMTFAAPPAALDTTSIVMTATTATDADSLPVDYFFENTTNLSNSGWITGTVWTNTGLTTGATYGYRVKARDAVSNETAWSAEATAVARVLVKEDFQTPMYTSGTADPVFTGWTWGNAGYLRSRTAVSQYDVPVNLAGNNSNQVIQIENITTLNQNTTYNWARAEAYTLTLNASPQDWNGQADRYIVASLLQTNGVVLWSRSTLMPKYSNFGRNPWTAVQTFMYTILSDAFTNGAAGQPLRLQITQSGQRGIYVDNVQLEKLAVPPPDTTLPTPNPMTWYLVPTPVGGRGITMIANTAVDDNYGVQYLFENETRGSISGWQSSSTWTETGLDDAATYTYRVKARDTSPNSNETGWSSSLSATTKDPANPVLLNEDFQTPLYPGNTAAPYFAGWNLTGALRAPRGGGDGAPGNSVNQLLQFEWAGINNRSEYDLYHNWSRGTLYTLTLNAAPQAWSGASQRYFVADILQQNGTLLWTSGSVAIPMATPPSYTDYQGLPWPQKLTFSFDIPSDNFTAGTEGQPLRVRIYTTGSRGVYVDNIVMDYIKVAYWDINGTNSGAGGPAPAGTWDATSTYWTTATNGDGPTAAWTGGKAAFFAAGADATGTYTVDVAGTQDISGLHFEDGTVALSPGAEAALRLVANSPVYAAAGLTAIVEVAISDDGAGRQLSKTGGGTLALSGGNTYTGGTTVRAGVIGFESANSIGGTARNVAVDSGGTVMFGPAFGAANIQDALSTRIVASSAGAIAADNYGATSFDFNTPGLTAAFLGAVGDVSYTGTLTPNGTTYRLGGGGGTLVMVNASAVTGAGNSLIVNGNVTLPAANDYTGGTTLNAGALTIGDAGALGAGTFAIAGPGTVQAAGTVVTTNAVAASSDFTVGGAGALTLGNMTLSANVVITVTNTVAVTTFGSISGATRTLTFSGNGDATVAGIIATTSGALTKTGAGTLRLPGVNTYNGASTIRGGTLLGETAGSCVGSAVTVTNTPGNTSALGIRVTDPTKQWTCASLAFSTNGVGSELQFSFAVAPNDSLAPLNITGNLTFNGTPLVVIDPVNLGFGTYPLLVVGGTAPSVVPALSAPGCPGSFLSWGGLGNKTLYFCRPGGTLMIVR